MTEVDQRLVDAIFAIASRSFEAGNYADNPLGNEHEEWMKWVADQLRGMGIDTKPMGMSWGVIKNTGD